MIRKVSLAGQLLILQLGIQLPLIVLGHRAISWNLPTVYRESIAATLSLLCALMTMLVCARGARPPSRSIASTVSAP